MFKVLAIGVALLAAGTGGYAVVTGHAPWNAHSADTVVIKTIAVTIASSNGKHAFNVESAATPAQQERGLMFRTDLKPDGGMLFWPYPADGAAAREASFWMKNTPTPLDILFIRADGTIATIAENTVPYSETPVLSREPVAAVLEVVGGRAADLGIAEGDKVSWPQTK